MALAHTKTASGEKAPPKWTARPEQSIMLVDSGAQTGPVYSMSKTAADQIEQLRKTSLPADMVAGMIQNITAGDRAAWDAAHPAPKRKTPPVVFTPYDPIPGAGVNNTTAPMSWKLSGNGQVWANEEQWLLICDHAARIKSAIIKRRDS
jgi:hypothetical protein